MKRRTFLFGTGLLAAGGAYAAHTLPAYRLQTGLQFVSKAVAGPSTPPTEATSKSFALPNAWAGKLIEAAESQIGVTVVYDPAYVSLPFPNGDLPRERGYAPMWSSEPIAMPSATISSRPSMRT